MIKPKKLTPGDTIGFISPGRTEEPYAVEASAAALEKLGYRAKCAKHLFDRDLGYAASAAKRAADFCQMALDDEVSMVFFSGGEAANELLPHLDFEQIAAHPKIWCSDGGSTALLNAIATAAGLVTFYGSDPAVCSDDDFCRIRSLFRAVCDGIAPCDLEKSGAWTTLRGGEASGELIGGLLPDFALMLGGRYLRYDKTKRYLLFLEMHEQSGSLKYLAHLEQSGLMQNVAGVIVGGCADCPETDSAVARLAERWMLPAVRIDGFGHGGHRAVLPIGVHALLDADAQTLRFAENAVDA